MSNKKVIAIDFDGVVHDFKNPVSGRTMGGPIEGTLDALNLLRDAGYQIIIFTFRGWAQYVVDWLDYYNIPYDSITNTKPNADFYIDDKGLRFTNWPDIIKQIIK